LFPATIMTEQNFWNYKIWLRIFSSLLSSLRFLSFLITCTCLQLLCDVQNCLLLEEVVVKVFTTSLLAKECTTCQSVKQSSTHVSCQVALCYGNSSTPLRYHLYSGLTLDSRTLHWSRYPYCGGECIRNRLVNQLHPFFSILSHFVYRVPCVQKSHSHRADLCCKFHRTKLSVNSGICY
jgi:hypothetical protein